MLLRVCWLFLMSLALNISAEIVYSHGSQYGGEPGGQSTPATTKPLPQEVEMLSTGGSNDPSFKTASYDPNSSSSPSGLASGVSRPDFMQLGDAYSSPAFSSMNSSPSVSGSNLVQDLQPVVSNKNTKYNPSTHRIALYGSVYRLLKLHDANSSSRSGPSESRKPSISSSAKTTSKSTQNGQNSHKAGYSRITYNATQLRDAYSSVAATYYSRNKPSLSRMVISSGPMIFIRSNQSTVELVETINKAQRSYEPGAPIKPLMTADQPTAETSKPFENIQGVNYQRPISQPQVPNKFQSPQTPPTSTPQSRMTRPRITQLGNAYSSWDTSNKLSSVSKPAQTTYRQQTAKPMQSSQQLSDFYRNVVHDSSFTAGPMHGSVYRFPRPRYVYGTSRSTGTSVHMPSSSVKTVQNDYMQHFYQTGLSFPKAGHGCPSSEVASGDSKYRQSGNGYGSDVLVKPGSADNVYTSNSQFSPISSDFYQHPYFVARRGHRSYFVFKPVQPCYKSFPTTYTQIPSK